MFVYSRVLATPYIPKIIIIDSIGSLHVKSHTSNASLPIVFILSTQSVHPMRVHNPEYQPPVTSGSRVTGCANFVN